MSELRRLTFFLLASSLIWTSVQGQHSYFNVGATDFLEKTKFIFVGKVVDQQSYWSDDRRFIMTRHVLSVRESVKGDCGNTVEITEYGGTVGNRSMTVTHSASYLMGQKYLIFSYLDSQNRNRTLAGPMGQFRVLSNTQSDGTIRIYPSHPLAQALKYSSIFQPVDTFLTTLRGSIEQSAR